MDDILKKNVLTPADEAWLLPDLQCNTLAPHRRNLSAQLFFRLGPDPKKNLAYVQAWAGRASTMQAQVEEERRRRANQSAFVQASLAARPTLEKFSAWLEQAATPPGRRSFTRVAHARSAAIRLFRTTAAAPRSLVRSVMFGGPALLKLPPWTDNPPLIDHYPPQDMAWRMGMWAYEPLLFAKIGMSPAELAQLRQDWLDPFRAETTSNRIDVHVLLAIDAPPSDDLARPDAPAELTQAIADEIGYIQALGGTQVGVTEWGYQSLLPVGGAQEHFGFRDGISNVHVLADELAQARREVGSPDSGATVANLLFPFDLKTTGTTTYGSLCVVRKIEEKVAEFRALPPADRAKLVPVIGRAPDGTPLARRRSPGLDDFDYAAVPDSTGQPVPSACPFHAHIRKANPRHLSTELNESPVLFARRGMIFGQREWDPATAVLGDITEPDQRVGLLFMGYMGSVEEQFAHMQRKWLDAENFPSATPSSGIDQLVGLDSPARLSDYTRVLGGEYFFVPSLTWLRSPGPRK